MTLHEVTGFQSVSLENFCLDGFDFDESGYDDVDFE